eukprot:maker-scaffold2587_size14210-snap-gene-0.5 protein:Tk06810 transcript:maker-scaffold2587_size14210-snap-gene-0.5-mRNA-1 annotation:"e3 ubiquitin-protein ligase uhrf1 isoform x3"
MHIKIRYEGRISIVPDISKMASVCTLKELIRDQTGLEPKKQRLIALGKQLDDDYTLIDYGMDVNCLVDVMAKVEWVESVGARNEEAESSESSESSESRRIRWTMARALRPPWRNKSQRDWGKGMATVGRSKSCSKVPSNHFGPIPGVEVGMCWKFRIQISEQGIHRPPVAGIAGRPNDGAYSIVLAGGYEDDVDNGDEFYYTGAGGRDLSGNKRTAEQSFDQVLEKTNLAIAVSCACPLDTKVGGEARKWREGKPIRVVRSEKLKKHSKFAPVEGCRYDGIYRVVKYWPEKGRSGFIVWRYLFRRDDDSPAPWSKAGRKAIEENGFSCIFPEGHLEAMAARLEAKNRGTKRTREGDSTESSSLPRAEPMTKFLVKKAKFTPKYKIPATISTMITDDQRNVKMWDDVKSTEMLTKLDFTNKVEENFRCLCCQELVYQPVTTSCHHNLCLACIKLAFKSDWTQCPSCRTDLKDEKLVANKGLQAVLLYIFPGYDNGRN